MVGRTPEDLSDDELLQLDANAAAMIMQAALRHDAWAAATERMLACHGRGDFASAQRWREVADAIVELAGRTP